MTKNKPNVEIPKTVGTSERVEKILDRFLNTTPSICAERAELITESYKETEGLPMPTRRAKALEKILSGMSIFIQDDEILVGNQCSMPRSAPIFPEFSCKWVEEELDRLAKRTSDVFLISEDVKAKLRKAFAYWDGKTVNEIASKLMPEESLEAHNEVVFTVGNYFYNGVGHISANYDKVLKLGLNAVIAQAEAKLAEIDFSDPSQLNKMHFLKSVVTANKAVIAFAERFAVLAEKMASACDDSERRAELIEIARICRKVPAQPAESFQEAMQAFWFIHLVIQIESNGHSISPMRFDQYMNPFLQADSISVEKAQELLDMLWVKFSELNKVRDENSSMAFAGYPMFMNLIVGGQKRDGSDATNTMSYLILQASANTKLYAPSLSIRIHEGTPDPLYKKAAELSRMGMGYPAYYNDRVIVPALLARGLEREDARDYGIIGCVEPQVGGKTEGWHDAAFYNMAKIIELCLNDGVDQRTGKQLGPKSGSMKTFKSFEDLMASYTQQTAHFVKLMAAADNAVDMTHGKHCPLPFLSSLVDDCISKGISLQEGGAHYNFTGPQGVGVANAGDSLTAIKKIVFDDKALTLEQLQEALANNFEGQEDLRQMLVNRAPKYGNDDDYADEIAKEAALIYCKEVNKYTNPRGGKFQPGLYPASANVPLGSVVTATPDGRKAWTPLADGVSPISGYDSCGPTASVLSVAKLDHEIASNGTLLNQKFHPSAIEGEKGLENLKAVTEAYFQNGGFHVQYNVISRETLLDAQANPEKHKGLVVRVAGYSAFFTALDKSLQDDILARTEQNF
ncbi:glycyl radical protein [Desulfovibrio gilichinskyi]|uniref:Glycerol dehydratase, cobalamin-independent, large subunit n=1 Tax=Desulfovibrio gilichinskyi TaxID=1519643 RepID=A0A1X7E828_9BACT|nr:glycyl radical protein [Desulfovibrio gilichinskyi]SMF29280.1 glycerol dehydratase, cobalamin-independent, large subunit [Desulfovibrio gilichinskyi]